MSDADPLGPIEKLAANRHLAHLTLFARRHQHESPDFHDEIINFLHSRVPYGVILAFRGAAKSTLAEEDLVLDALLRQFHNCVIVGSSETRAAERLLSIANELENNEAIQHIFGNVKSRPWGQTKIVLKNGVVIQAIGRDQAVRGLKHLDWRPDRVLLDDVEDRENVQTPLGRSKTMFWLLSELIPVCDPSHIVRCLATPMNPDSVPVRLIRDADWPSLTIPIKFRGEDGAWTPSWDDRYPLSWINEREEMYQKLGELHVFNQEYLCDTSPGLKGGVFPSLFVEHRVRTYEPVYIMVDPARGGTGRRTATTGFAVWSYIGPRIHVWKAEGLTLMPDKIIDHIMELDEEFSPVWVGVEETGLEEFIMQPLRAEMLKRNKIVPLKGIRAPRSKLDFISGLQPYAANGELTVNERFPDLDQQLANFPAGQIDVPNALAYALTMKPGLPVYDSFTQDHVVETLYIDKERDLWLAMNATKTLLTGVLLQYTYGKILIFADYVIEGDPADTVPLLLREVSMMARMPLKVSIGPHHWEQWQNVGLRQALARAPLDPERGTAPERGREVLRDEFQRLARGEPALRVARGARYTINGFAGGFARAFDRRHNPAAEPEAGLYRTLIEGLESCLGALKLEQAEEDGPMWAQTEDGRRYMRYGTAR